MLSSRFKLKFKDDAFHVFSAVEHVSSNKDLCSCRAVAACL